MYLWADKGENSGDGAVVPENFEKQENFGAALQNRAHTGGENVENFEKQIFDLSEEISRLCHAICVAILEETINCDTISFAGMT